MWFRSSSSVAACRSNGLPIMLRSSSTFRLNIVRRILVEGNYAFLKRTLTHHRVSHDSIFCNNLQFSLLHCTIFLPGISCNDLSQLLQHQRFVILCTPTILPQTSDVVMTRWPLSTSTNACSNGVVSSNKNVFVFAVFRYLSLFVTFNRRLLNI